MNKMRLFQNTLALFLLACYSNPLYAIFSIPYYRIHEHPEEKMLREMEGPFFTGPLLAPSPNIVPIYHTNFEPYIYVTKTSHVYDSDWHSKHVPTVVSSQLALPFWTGLSNSWDIQITPQASWNHSHGQARFVFNDFPVAIDYQLVKSKKDKWYPPIKLTIQETFPTGKYQHLNPHKNGTDMGGAGSYQTQFSITTGKLVNVRKYMWYNVRLNLAYTVPSSVHVEGFNAYGGARDTRGKAYPGNSFRAILGQEFSLNLHWALAFDIDYQHNDRNRFSGRKGISIPVGTATPGTAGIPVVAKVGGPSQEQLSIAPALEYNWNSTLGIIGGAWFTVAGRNSSDFTSYVVAFNWFY